MIYNNSTKIYCQEVPKKRAASKKTAKKSAQLFGYEVKDFLTFDYTDRTVLVLWEACEECGLALSWTTEHGMGEGVISDEFWEARPKNVTTEIVT